MIPPMSRRVLITRLAMCVLLRVATLKSLCSLLAQGRISLADIITMRSRLKKRARHHDNFPKYGIMSVILVFF